MKCENKYSDKMWKFMYDSLSNQSKSAMRRIVESYSEDGITDSMVMRTYYNSAYENDREFFDMKLRNALKNIKKDTDYRLYAC